MRKRNTPPTPGSKRSRRHPKAIGLLTPTTRVLDLPPVPPASLGNDEFYGSRGLILKSMGYKTYANYLDSPEWTRIRGNVLLADKCSCRCCGEMATEVHHTSYDIWTLRGGCLDGLHAICRKCHKLVEFQGRNKRTPSEMVSEFNKRVENLRCTRRGKISNPGTTVDAPGGARLADGGACTVSNSHGRTLVGAMDDNGYPAGVPTSQADEGAVIPSKLGVVYRATR